MEAFVESNMTFGPYAESHCFRVEVSETYRVFQEKVQMVEFLLLRTKADAPPFVWIVEAKQSSPRPETQPNFSEFIGEIRDKLANAQAPCTQPRRRGLSVPTLLWLLITRTRSGSGLFPRPSR